MAQIVSQPGSIVFTSDIDDIVISSSEEKGALTVVLTTPAGNDITVLEETLYTDSNGQLTVYDLATLLEPFAREYGRLTMGCSFDDGVAVASIEPVTILYCKADVGMTAEQFLQAHFLTVLDGEKITAYTREERLYAYGAVSVNVSATVVLPVGTIAEKTAVLLPVATVNDVAQFNVSPKKIIEAIDLVGGKLLTYTVSAGNRKQDFRMQEEQLLPEPSLVFVNSFGCEEFIHCSGTLKREGKFTRYSTRIRTKQKNYRVTEERKYTANTGWMNDAMADWAEELFRSDEVYLWENGRRGREIVLSDSKSEINNEDDFMTAFEFSYTYAQRLHNVMRKKTAVRIFSEQFEDIYN